MWAERTGRFSREGGEDRTFFPCGRNGSDVFHVLARRTGRFSSYGRVEPGVFSRVGVANRTFLPVWAGRTGRFSREGV